MRVALQAGPTSRGFRISILLCLGLLSGAMMVFAAGCSAEHHRTKADKEVYGILKSKWKDDFGQMANYQVNDSTPAAADIANAIPPSGVLNLAQAVAIATQYSRDYQGQKESLYLSALDLTLIRHQYAAQWFGTIDAAYTSRDGEEATLLDNKAGGTSSGIVAAGEKVYQGQTLISMPDTASMVAEISVHETEVDKIKPGQSAQIILDAFPDQILQGHVLEVAPLPDEQRGFMNPDLKVYKTLVTIDGSHDFLKTRMSCKVEIFVRQLKDVMLVPIQVVANRRGKKVLYVVNGQDAAQEREVKTGAFNDTFVQIVEGLNEGEQTLLNPPLFTESGAATIFQ